jgi:hypothetical protein
VSPEFAGRLERARAHLAALGVPRSRIAPPVYRWAWKLGLALPPPLFSGFGFHFIVQSALFAALWGLAMIVLVRVAGLFIPAAYVAIAAALAGLTFGLAMAFFLRHKARRLSLPPWESM